MHDYSFGCGTVISDSSLVPTELLRGRGAGGLRMDAGLRASLARRSTARRARVEAIDALYAREVRTRMNNIE